MKKLLPFIAVLLFACKESITNNLKDKLQIYFSERLKNADSTIHLDSVRIIKMDTVTKKMLINEAMSKILNEVQTNQLEYDGRISFKH